MDERITLSTLVSMLSLNTGDSKKDTEDFIRELFALIAEALERGESIKVKGLGVFKTINVEARKSVNVNDGTETLIPQHKKVTFTPSKEIALLVNEPFEMFQTVEITEEAALRLISDDNDSVEVDQDDNGDTGQLEEEEDFSEVKDQEPAIAGDNNDGVLYQVTEEYDSSDYTLTEQIPFGNVSDDSNNMDESRQEDCTPGAIMTSSEESPGQETVIENNEEVALPAEDDEPGDAVDYDDQTFNFNPCHARNYYWFGVVTGIIVSAIGMVLFWNLYGKEIKKPVADTRNSQIIALSSPKTLDNVTVISGDSSKNEEVKAEEKSIYEEAIDVPTNPSDERKFDTITTTRYLTTMAKDHYGNYHLWPYIYKENEKILGHPDRIRPGTKVVIPPLSKYGVDPSNPAEIEKAKKMGTEIYSRYK